MYAYTQLQPLEQAGGGNPMGQERGEQGETSMFLIPVIVRDSEVSLPIRIIPRTTPTLGGG